MSLKIKIIHLLDLFRRLRRRILGFLDAIGILAALTGFILLLYHIGFEHTKVQIISIHKGYNLLLFMVLLSDVAGLGLKTWKVKALKQRLADLILIPLIIMLLDIRTGIPGLINPSHLIYGILSHNLAVYFLIVFILITEISTSSLQLSNRNTNPALLFVSSFLFIIVFGTGLLMLPTATYGGIGFTDAFFTSTSAVCVTGLVVFDTATKFTPLGQAFIIILIQIGGLGIMTFTSFFGYFFKGGASFGNEFLLKELINEEKLGEIFKTLLKIVLVTFSIEAAGALLIYFTVEPSFFSGRQTQLGFAVFHSISAFCNAGFSTLSSGLFQPGFRYNYSLHYIIAFLIIAGGLGFPIVFNYYKLVRHFLLNKFRQLTGQKSYYHIPNIININTRIALITTGSLIIAGFAFFMISEFNHSLEGLSLKGKIAGAFFGSVTARTAGFNSVDMMLFAPATILFYYVLMWIGASPASTGGGVKTTTFALALMNVVSMAKGKDRIEVFGREIANESVRRAFAVIFLSFLVIGLAVLILMITDGVFGLSRIIFEVISAYGTVGLSLNVTPGLSVSGKWVLIVTMFLGRVGTLTLMVGLFRKLRSLQYHYPTENILIN
ncbi:MAG: Trk-type K+ transport system membrane component [Bacteroidetes bacterium]|nr:MAG: Trk-type K+ transport system membrane component [Bacteroidota bacterium]